MVYCNFCACEVDVEADDANGFSCCVQCGRVLEDTAFAADVAFAKDAAGESTVVGQFVNESGQARGLGRMHGGKIYSYQADSHEKAQQRGRYEIAHLVDLLGIRPREESVESAHRLYKLALQRNFTRGRRTNQVAAACLYLVCRQDGKPFLLIDFSDALQVNVFVLGAVFLQLVKLLRVEDHPMFSKPVDPSLYIHRFADRLGFGRQMHAVANTALRLVASMKRDWMQTGRRPSGVCGASLYIAAHIHGFERTKKDVVSVVHVGETTLSKRLNEFTTTSAGELTAEDFEKQVAAIDTQERQAIEASQPAQVPTAMLEYGCEHRRLGEAHFAHGMCKACFLEFFAATGGMYAGANPPAFEAARLREQQEAEKAQLQAAAEAEEAAQRLLEGGGPGGSSGAPLLALPAPGDVPEEGQAGEGAGAGATAYDREEAAIADEMAHALEGREMQPFAALLGEGGGKAGVDGGAAAAAEADGDGAGGAVAAEGGRKKKQPVRRKQGAAAEATAAEPAQQQQQGQQQQAGDAISESPALPGRSTAPQGEAAAPATQQSEQGTEEPGAEPTPAAAAAGAAGAAEPGSAEPLLQQPQQQQEQDACATAPVAAAAAATGGGGADPVLPAVNVDTGEGEGEPSAETAEAEAAAAAAPAAAAAAAPTEAEAGAGAGRDGGAVVAVEAAGGEAQEEDGGLSDISDTEIGAYIAEEAEVAVKEEIWNLMNADWLEKQAAKQAAREAAERARSEEDAEAEAAAAAGIEYKRKRGRPSGSKSKKGGAGEELPPAETPQEAALRMLDHKKLSSKINYSVLAELFEDGSGGGGEGEEGGEDGEEDGGASAAAAVRSELREREAAQEAQAGAKAARQAQALEAERGRKRGLLGSGGLGGFLSSGLGGGLGGAAPPSGRLGALGGSFAGAGAGASRPLGSLRDPAGGAKAGGKRVRFS